MLQKRSIRMKKKMWLKLLLPVLCIVGMTVFSACPVEEYPWPYDENEYYNENRIWYVAAGGSDTNDARSISAPLATVKEALSRISRQYSDHDWPGKGTPAEESAKIVISGTITADNGGNNYMIEIGGTVPIELRGLSAAEPGIIDATGKGKSVLYIAWGTLTMGDYLTLTGGNTVEAVFRQYR
jgi:hypothetical protein